MVHDQAIGGVLRISLLRVGLHFGRKSRPVDGTGVEMGMRYVIVRRWCKHPREEAAQWHTTNEAASYFTGQ